MKIKLYPKGGRKPDKNMKLIVRYQVFCRFNICLYEFLFYFGILSSCKRLSNGFYYILMKVLWVKNPVSK